MQTGTIGTLSKNTINFQMVLWRMMSEEFLKRAYLLAEHHGVGVVTGYLLKRAMLVETLSSKGMGAKLEPYFNMSMDNDIDFENLPPFIKEKALEHWEEFSGIINKGSISNIGGMAEDASSTIINSLVEESGRQDGGGQESGGQESGGQESGGQESGGQESGGQDDPSYDDYEYDEYDDYEYDDEGGEGGDEESNRIIRSCRCPICREIDELEVFISTWKPSDRLHQIILNSLNMV
jgi:hypothetical protein